MCWRAGVAVCVYCRCDAFCTGKGLTRKATIRGLPKTLSFGTIPRVAPRHAPQRRGGFFQRLTSEERWSRANCRLTERRIGVARALGLEVVGCGERAIWPAASLAPVRNKPDACAERHEARVAAEAGGR